jgi:hypothetical protein
MRTSFASLPQPRQAFGDGSKEATWQSGTLARIGAEVRPMFAPMSKYVLPGRTNAFNRFRVAGFVNILLANAVKKMRLPWKVNARSEVRKIARRPADTHSTSV